MRWHAVEMYLHCVLALFWYVQPLVIVCTYLLFKSDVETPPVELLCFGESNRDTHHLHLCNDLSVLLKGRQGGGIRFAMCHPPHAYRSLA